MGERKKIISCNKRKNSVKYYFVRDTERKRDVKLAKVIRG